jgi:hypothetical protein
MSVLRKCVLLQRKPTSMEGRYCIFSEHSVSGPPPETTLTTNSSPSGDMEIRR